MMKKHFFVNVVTVAFLSGFVTVSPATESNIEDSHSELKAELEASQRDMDEAMIIEILRKDCDRKIVVGYVCQRLSLSDLYEKWLGCEPEFYVLSDFSNPLNMQFFGISMEPHMHRRHDGGETLRGKLKFEKEKIITALIDGNGDLVYLNTDAGNKLAGSLTQINNLIKEGKNAEKQD